MYTNSGNLPEFIIKLIPELYNDKEEFVMNKLRDGRRIIPVKSKDIDSLMESINKLPNDFLDKDY